MVILFLAILFSDLLKFLPPGTIPFLPSFLPYYSVYLYAIIIIYKMNFFNFKYDLNVKQKKVLYLLILLSILYLFSFLTSLFGDITGIVQIFTHFLYVVIPNIFLIAFIKIKSINLNLVSKVNRYLIIAFSLIFLIGFIQYFDNEFFLNTNYSEYLNKSEGLVRRATVAGYFLKINSIFSSPDRFALVSKNIFMISIFNLFLIKNKFIKEKLEFIPILGIFFSLGGMILAGARASIVVSILVILVTCFFYFFNSKNKVYISKNLKDVFAFGFPITILVITFIPSIFSKIIGSTKAIGVFGLLFSRGGTNELISRAFYQFGLGQEGFLYNRHIADQEIPFFGFGLGSMGFGKPGESGIFATISESGFIIGILIIVTLLSIAILLSYKSIGNISKNNFGFYFVLIGFFLNIIFGTATGLVSLYEPTSFFIIIPSVASSFIMTNREEFKI